jgi:Family of unknown function (DUF6132)
MLLNEVADQELNMNHPVVRFLAYLLVGAGIGAVMGYFGQCSSGTCPLTSTWWRGALYGGLLGLLMALGSRS